MKQIIIRIEMAFRIETVKVFSRYITICDRLSMHVLLENWIGLKF
jgi:hypothetical protein